MHSPLGGPPGDRTQIVSVMSRAHQPIVLKARKSGFLTIQVLVSVLRLTPLYSYTANLGKRLHQHFRTSPGFIAAAFRGLKNLATLSSNNHALIPRCCYDSCGKTKFMVDTNGLEPLFFIQLSEETHPRYTGFTHARWQWAFISTPQFLLSQLTILLIRTIRSALVRLLGLEPRLLRLRVECFNPIKLKADMRRPRLRNRKLLTLQSGRTGIVYYRR